MPSSDDDAPDVSKPAGSTPEGTKRWKLPSLLDHFNSHDLKIFFRCWAAAWVAMLLVFIHPSLVSIGQATFFATILLIIVPPASILLVYLLAALSLVFGMSLAWAWGLLTMKAALAARPDSETQAMAQTLKQQAGMIANQTGQSPEWEAQILVHQGAFFDPRVTVIFYVMGCLFIYALARVSVKNPKFLLAQLFGTVVTDLFILFGPSLPKFNSLLGKVLVEPAAIGAGIGAACCLLFFPQSTSFVALDKMEKLIRLLDMPLKSTLTRLQKTDVSLEHLRSYRSKLISLYRSNDPSLAFLPLDLSRGRWSADDVKNLNGYVREALVAGLSLIDFHITWVRIKEKEALLEKHQAEQDSEDKIDVEKRGHKVGHRQLAESADMMFALRDPERGAMDARALDSLGKSTPEALKVCREAVELAGRSIHTVNSGRWLRTPKQPVFDSLTQDLQNMITKLRTATDECITKTTEGVIESYGELWDTNGQLKNPEAFGPPSLKGIALSMILEERILTASRKLEALLRFILQLTQTRTHHRIWFPSRLQYFFSWVSSGRNPFPSVSESNVDSAENPDTTDPAMLEDQAKEAYRRLNVSRGNPGTSAQRSFFSRAVAGTSHWLFGPAGMFALKMVIVTVVTALPASFASSAGFFYREKGIWAVISAQTCMNVYMADFTFSLVSRVAGTVLGGIIGMVGWYIGSGTGPGNPYGMAASTGVMLIIIIWVRIFLPPAYTKATILGGVTFVLVTGFSYDEAHIVQYGLPGKGYEAFWKRLVTVLIGFTAATIVQIMPKPPSATRHVSKTLANTVRTLSDHYALLLSHWGEAPGGHVQLRSVADEISIAVANNLLALEAPISQLKFELSLSPFDQKTLHDVQEQSQYMNQSLRRLLHLSTDLPKQLQVRMVDAFGFADKRMVGDIMVVLSIIEQSLRTGCPLPERIPTPLVNRFYEAWYANNQPPMLSVDLVRDESYRRFCVAMSSYLKFLANIDELVLILKNRLGECHVIHRWEDEVPNV